MSRTSSPAWPPAAARAWPRRARVHGDAELWRWAEASPPPPRLLLSPQGFDVIAEVKLRSPAVG